MRFCLILGCLSAAVLTAAEKAVPERKAVHVVSVVRADHKSGRLVRAVTRPAPSADQAEDNAWKENSAAIDLYVHEMAAKYQVDPLLVRSVIQVESNYNPLAVSPKGAQGLMQLMPGTARRFEVKNSFNPWENIEGGVRYLKYLLTLFGGEQDPETLAVAAYNAGENAVLRYGGVPPYPETTQYVEKVAKRWSSARATVPAASGATEQAERQPVIEQYVDAQGVLHMETRPSP